MTATYTFDIFCSLDGYGSHHGDWGGYWGKQGPEFLAHRAAQYDAEQRMVFGGNTYREFIQLLGEGAAERLEGGDRWLWRMLTMPVTVVSSTLSGPLDWPQATLVSGDAVDVVTRLKNESDVPLRSHGSVAMNASLMAAGLVDRDRRGPGCERGPKTLAWGSTDRQRGGRPPSSRWQRCRPAGI